MIECSLLIKKIDELILFVYYKKLFFFIGGDFCSYLIENKDNLRLKELLLMCKDVVIGMVYLECKKFFYR